MFLRIRQLSLLHLEKLTSHAVTNEDNVDVCMLVQEKRKKDGMGRSRQIKAVN